MTVRFRVISSWEQHLPLFMIPIQQTGFTNKTREEAIKEIQSWCNPGQYLEILETWEDYYAC